VFGDLGDVASVVIPLCEVAQEQIVQIVQIVLEMSAKSSMRLWLRLHLFAAHTSASIPLCLQIPKAL
jgi:Na+-transporting methylmalonyl-CoA/oxaloacetate decarboxylase beta subunit